MGAWEWNLATGRVSWTAALERIHGIPEGSFAGNLEAYERDVHPDDRERIRAAIAQSLNEPEPPSIQYRIVRPDGQVRWLEAHGRIVRTESGEPEHLLGVCRDITERVKAERLQREKQEWIATTLRSIGDAVVATGRTGHVILVNRAAEELIGWLEKDARGRRIEEVFQIVDGQTRAVMESPAARVLRQDAPDAPTQAILRRSDGREVFIEDTSAPIRDGTGQAIGAVIVLRDVSKARKEELQRSFLNEATATLALSLDTEETLTTIARHAVPHVADWCTVDLVENGEVRRLGVAHVDPARVELALEVQRRFPPRMDAPAGVPHVVRTGRPEVVTDISDTLLAAACRNDEHLALMRRLGFHSYMVVPMRSRDRVIGAITFVNSESDRSFGEEDLRVAQELADCAGIAVSNSRLVRELQEAVRARDEVVAVVSHDLRNPLSVIMMKASGLLRRLPENRERLVRDLDAVRRNGERMERLIRDLLDAARMGDGSLPLALSTCDPSSIVQSAMEFIQPVAAARGQVLEAEVRTAGEQIFCDRERVLQVLGNLLGNAAKFTPEGGRISIRCDRLENEVRFVVSDSGPGVPDERRDRIFERYWSSPEGNREGTGLGLYIARGLVEAQGGRIWLYGNGPEGAAFAFTLPLDQTDASERVA